MGYLHFLSCQPLQKTWCKIVFSSGLSMHRSGKILFWDMFPGSKNKTQARETAHQKILVATMKLLQMLFSFFMISLLIPLSVHSNTHCLGQASSRRNSLSFTSILETARVHFCAPLCRVPYTNYAHRLRLFYFAAENEQKLWLIPLL